MHVKVRSYGGQIGRIIGDHYRLGSGSTHKKQIINYFQGFFWINK
jgi:hypothetical protein